MGASKVVVAGVTKLDLTSDTVAADNLISGYTAHAITGKAMTRDELKDIYTKNDYEAKILLPDRVNAMCSNLFKYLLETGSPMQKTIVFCVRESHEREHR